jgi:acyl carrier protein
VSMPAKSEILDGLRTFICTELMQHPSYPLMNDEPLMSGGLIDSFCIAHIAVFIEQAWGVYIPDTELTVEKMDTLDLIAARVLQG